MIQSPTIESLDQEGDESAVRMRLAHSQYSPSDVPIVEEWLRRREASRIADSSAKRDSREEETLRIAKEALSSAKDANRIASEQAASAFEQARWAKWAAIIAAIAAIVAAKDAIILAIFG